VSIHVRRHTRVTETGRTVTVRSHEREGYDGTVPVPPWSRPVPVSALPVQPVPQADDIWDDSAAEGQDEVSDREARHSEELDRTKQQMREWRSRPVPAVAPDEPMSPQMEKLMGCDTPEGREKYDRLRAYREAGYDGPLGPDNRIPDPDDPASQDALSALAWMRL